LSDQTKLGMVRTVHWLRENDRHIADILATVIIIIIIIILVYYSLTGNAYKDNHTDQDTQITV